MNLVLLFPDDFTGEGHVRLTGRRLLHVTEVVRAGVGDELAVGLLGGRVGRGRVEKIDGNSLEMEVLLDREAPARLPLTLIVALPRPKALSRVIETVSSMGVSRLFLINSWRVEKSFWHSARLEQESLTAHAHLGIEQSRDTVPPEIHIRKSFVKFVEDEAPSLIAGTSGFVAHPAASTACPSQTAGPVTLAIGPEGGFLPNEVLLMERAGLTPVNFGPRILRVETAIPAFIGRLIATGLT